jgi:hypothetical protein
MKSSTITALLAAALLTACGAKEVSFDTLETARLQGKANAEWNAQVFRAASPQYSNTALDIQVDSSMTPSCPQGDGWASGKLVDKANPAVKVAIKCSTVSGAIGCLRQDEFEKKPFATDDGSCQTQSKVPFPIPKIAK